MFWFARFDFILINSPCIQRDCGRAPIPRKDPGIKVEEEPLLSNHPYVDKVSLSRHIFNCENIV